MLRALALLLALTAACSTDTCQTVPVDIGDFCIPRALAANRQGTIELRELCGRGCSHQPSCSAFLRNGQVVLDVQQDICQESGFFQCIALGCVQRVVRCKLPELREGDYAMVAPGAAVQLLRVRADGDASCHFAVPGDGGV